MTLHKKSLGQHFLIDHDILKRISDEIESLSPISTLIEVGPGMGALTEYLTNIKVGSYWVIEKDDRFVAELPSRFPILHQRVIHQDVLTVDLSQFNDTSITVVGNYPYNISNLIMFWIIENSHCISQSVGMFQKEVAVRLAASHGNKNYGILSVLTQSMYDVQYLFDIPATCFDPPPKVVSGIIQMKRLPAPKANYNKLKKLVKVAFNQRRKVMSNSLKSLVMEPNDMFESIKSLRPEQLSVDQFCELSQYVV